MMLTLDLWLKNQLMQNTKLIFKRPKRNILIVELLKAIRSYCFQKIEYEKKIQITIKNFYIEEL